MSSYLITGGAGFVGSNLVELLLKEPSNTITIIDDLSMGSLQNLPHSKRIVFFQRSITDYKFVNHLLSEQHFDYIVLLAAIASVADSVDRPYKTHLINQEANLNIIETLRQKKITFKKLFFASSAAVYGSLPGLPKREDMAVQPLTQYAVDKYATERAILNYSRLYNMPMVCARFFNIYGPKQNPSSPYSGVLSILMNCLAHDKTFTFFGDGHQVRDFIYIKDVVTAIDGLLHSPDVKGDVFNIANGNQTTLKEVVELLEEISGKKFKLAYKPVRAGDIQVSYADIAKINQFSFMTHTPLIKGLTQYMQSI